MGKKEKYDSDPTAFTEEEALEIVEKTDNSIWYNKKYVCNAQ